MQAVVQGLRDGSSALVVCALGGALWQLKRSFIDHEVLSLGKCFAYIPPDYQLDLVTSANSRSSASACYTAGSMDVDVNVDGVGRSNGDNENQGNRNTYLNAILSAKAHSSIESDLTAAGDSSDSAFTSASDNTYLSGSSTTISAAAAGTGFTTPSSPEHMVLDAVALTNLEILVTCFDRSEKGSLWSFVNRTKTPFGRRLMREWLCKPLYRSTDIGRRANAVKELMGNLAEEADKVKTLLKGVCDLERLLGRVHSNGSKKRSSDHPDSRAIMYEMQVYNGRKIKDFADVLEGFEKLLKVAQVFSGSHVRSPLLARAVKSIGSKDPTSGTATDGRFPLSEMSSLLSHFRTVFDEKQAKREGTIKPRPGVDAEYDHAKDDVSKIEAELEQYLREQKRVTGINDLKFWGTNKDRFQIEV